MFSVTEIGEKKLSEELTVSVRQEVELWLRTGLRDFEVASASASAIMPSLEPFYLATALELRRLVEDYVEGGKAAVAEPRQEIEVGDMVELTGRMWGNVKSPKIGERYVVSEVSDVDGPSFLGPDGTVWYVFSNDRVEWGAKIYKKASEL